MHKKGLGVVGGALIVAGTSIGAGMLALPVVTGPAGFFPSITLLAISWAFMTITGLFFAELSLWIGHNANILTMAKKTLGWAGEVCTWFIYLFLFYCLLVAYLVGGGNLLQNLLPADSSHVERIMLFALIFITLVMLGKQVVDPINRLFMAGLFVAYFFFVFIGVSSVQPEFLQHADWSKAKWALPIAFTSFGFQGTVPTLSSWMLYDRKKIHTAIISGTTITLCIYAIWQALFLGIVPLEGENGLKMTLELGRDAVYPLQFFTESSHVSLLGKAFAFFAIATSFLGVGIGIVDFLRDGLKIEKRGVPHYVALVALAFGLPLFFALTYPNIFLHALGMAGGFGSALLLGLLPILMVWSAKYKLDANLCNGSFLSSRFIMLFLVLFVLVEIAIEIQMVLS